MTLQTGSVMVGTRKGLLIGQGSGKDWTFQTHFEGIPIALVTYDTRTETIWAGQHHGHWGTKLRFSKDGGASWQEVDAPKYPESAKLADGEATAMKGFWAFAFGHADQPGRMYVGTQPGAMFISDDNGASFQFVDSLWALLLEHKWFGGGADDPVIHSIIVDPRDANRLWVGVSCGGVYETTDGCKTWTARNKGLRADFMPEPDNELNPHDPHCLMQSPSNPDVLWQQNHCGIWRSSDAGQQWDEVTEKDGPANFGFPIAVDEKNADCAWVIPGVSDEVRMPVNAALCVCRSDDGGKTWTAFRKGLPQEHCYDVVFRHALDVSGDRLIFGSTTGNVFVSEDRGESWSSLGHYFAPIYVIEIVK